MRAEARSLRRARAAARAPRVALLTVTAVLAACGVRSLLTGPSGPAVAAVARPSAPPSAVVAMAQAFVRAYWSWGADPSVHDRAVAALSADGLDAGAGIQPVSGTSQQVTWTTVASVSGDGPGRWMVLVGAATSRDAVVRWLWVPVSRDRFGAVAVSDYPSPSGPPARDSAAGPVTGTPVDDPGLLEVARRAIGNYLRRNADDLRADLAAGARITLPAAAMTPGPVDQLSWVERGQVAADLTAADASGARMRIRMRLLVVRGERWLVRAINPTTKET